MMKLSLDYVFSKPQRLAVDRGGVGVGVDVERGSRRDEGKEEANFALECASSLAKVANLKKKRRVRDSCWEQ
ncbi:unnamed protein product [Litomosoides sigmodontis]|uniref:Uncharacterized protein n=1 Tax=Litomosoides sigmodontis TaxID=42156 RepID=A0A3P6S7D2_LITSI|nr:unnamed protein product [Litomosoides sigmodontis]